MIQLSSSFERDLILSETEVGLVSGMNMSYAIDEQNLERQRLLARILNPLTAPHLAALDVDRAGRWLEIVAGCGRRGAGCRNGLGVSRQA